MKCSGNLPVPECKLPKLSPGPLIGAGPAWRPGSVAVASHHTDSSGSPAHGATRPHPPQAGTRAAAPEQGRPVVDEALGAVEWAGAKVDGYPIHWIRSWTLRSWTVLRHALLVAALVGGVVSAPRAEPLRSCEVIGDTIPRPLTGAPGDPQRGRQVVASRELGNCLLCHRMPLPEERFQGDLGPDLAGVARRLSAAQIRLRVVDESRLNAATIMPPYYRVEGLRRVLAAYRDRPVLTAEQVEDVVALLSTFR